MNNISKQVHVLPIPWMKQKLENIYETNLYGNLFLIYSDLDYKNYNYVDSSVIAKILDNYNICVNETNPIYLYIPAEVNEFIKNLILSFKILFNDNVYIILGAHKERYTNFSNLDLVVNLYTKFPELEETIYQSYLIDMSKSYEIFTSLSDTQRIYIDPISSCTISGPTLNYHIKQSNPNNITHISFVNLLDEALTDNSMSYYLKGLTNNNNNFNFNF